MRARDGVGAEIERGREAYAQRAWQDAFDALSGADEASPLGAEDVELLAIAASMLAREDEGLSYLERAHRLYLERGNQPRAIYAAIWICLVLFTRGEIGPASGWLGRTQRLLENEQDDRGQRGYLLIPRIFQEESEGDFAAAAGTAEQAREIGERAGDADLFVLGLCSQGQMLLKDGRVREGLALLDEGDGGGDRPSDLSPDRDRASSTAASSSPARTVFEAAPCARVDAGAPTGGRWGSLQMVAFTGRCLVHRAEVFQLHGSWPDALEEAHSCRESGSSRRSNPAAGLAHYRQRGASAPAGRVRRGRAAPTATRARFGWEPQPGLAQLRLAQGTSRPRSRRDPTRGARRRHDAARSAQRLMPASVEIMLAVRRASSPRAVAPAGSSRRSRSATRARCCAAMVAHAQGAVAPRGRRSAQPRSSALRESGRDLAARSRRRTRSRGRACSSARRAALLGDEDAADARARGGDERLRTSSARRRTSPGVERVPRAGRRTSGTVCPTGRSRCCALSLPARPIAQSPRPARHQRENHRAACPAHLHEARSIDQSCRHGVRVQARPRIAGVPVHRNTHAVSNASGWTFRPMRERPSRPP